jgi:hypothetical protein
MDFHPLHIPYLLRTLTECPHGVLREIDADPRIKKREMAHGLIVATCGPQLPEPAKPHELLSKGIVYARDPYRVVSLPLVKMYNLGLHQAATTLHDTLLDEGAQAVLCEKLDGTMIQIFEHEGEVLLATRGAGEGTQGLTGWSFVEAARAILTSHDASALDPRYVYGKTLICELIHPENRIITRYGQLTGLVLHAVYVHPDAEHPWGHYMGFEAMEGLSVHLALPLPERYSGSIEDAIFSVEMKSGLHEGLVVQLEQNGEVVHRVKVKTQAYVRMHALKFDCSYKRVVETCWNAQLDTWEAFKTYLLEQGLHEEELMAEYAAHFEAFKVWKIGVTGLKACAGGMLLRWDTLWGDAPRDHDYFKGLALRCKEAHAELLPVVMDMARGKHVTLHDVACRFEPCKGFRAMCPPREDA